MDALTQTPLPTTRLAATATSSLICSTVTFVDTAYRVETSLACSNPSDPNDMGWWQKGMVPTLTWALVIYSLFSIIALIAMLVNGRINWKLDTSDAYIDTQLRNRDANIRAYHSRRSELIDFRLIPVRPSRRQRRARAATTTRHSLQHPDLAFAAPAEDSRPTTRYPVRPQTQTHEPLDRGAEAALLGPELGFEHIGSEFSASSITTEQTRGEDAVGQARRQKKLRRVLALEQHLLRQHCL